jgi:hypothetical protein
VSLDTIQYSIERHADLLADLERRSMEPVESRKAKKALRGIARSAEVQTMKWLLSEKGIAARSTRQVENGEFSDLPPVMEVAREFGLALPGFVVFTADEIDAEDDAVPDDEDQDDEIDEVAP